MGGIKVALVPPGFEAYSKGLGGADLKCVGME
jgi:hypothetical protein